jgi:hypothetical protein
MYSTPSDELRTMFHPLLFSRNPPVVTAEQIDELVSAASALGVCLPPCFRRFMIARIFLIAFHTWIEISLPRLL